MSNCLNEFKKAFRDYPSQDNEGIIPHRGWFKVGWFLAWEFKERENALLNEQIKEMQAVIDEFVKKYTGGKCE